MCSTLNNISNGNIAMSTNGSVTAATFTCFAGYRLTGTGSLYCRVDGSWSDSTPACGKILFLSYMINDIYMSLALWKGVF